MKRISLMVAPLTLHLSDFRVGLDEEAWHDTIDVMLVDNDALNLDLRIRGRIVQYDKIICRL